MVIEKNLFVLCENTILDNNGKLTVVNIYDMIYADTVPAVHGRLYFVANIKLQDLSKEDSKVAVKLYIKSPSNIDMLPQAPTLEIQPDLSKKIQNIGIRLEVNGVVFSEFGTYEAIFKIGDKTLPSLFFEFAQTPKGKKVD